MTPYQHNDFEDVIFIDCIYLDFIMASLETELIKFSFVFLLTRMELCSFYKQTFLMILYNV